MTEAGCPIKVLLADDHDLVRQGLAALIRQEPLYQVVAQCDSGSDVLPLVRSTSPDVAVLDLAMPALNGIEVSRQLLLENLPVRVVILSMHCEPRLVAQALAAGAAGYVTKESVFEHLIAAIATVHAGGLYLGPGVPQPGLASQPPEPADPYHSLTPREREILALIAQGKDTRTIAAELGISAKTVSTHRVRLMGKLDIHHQVALARYAIEKCAACSL